MSALTIIETALATTPDEWIDRGRCLADRRRVVDWEIADWMIEGRQAGYLNQTGFEFLGEKLGLAPKRLKDAIKAADHFPPALRDSSLSVEHYAAVSSLPDDEALPLLKRASIERLPVNALRNAVQQYRYDHGQNFADEDTDTTLATLVLRAWNRATPEARGLAFERLSIAASSGFGIIDEDEVTDEQD